LIIRNNVEGPRNEGLDSAARIHLNGKIRPAVVCLKMQVVAPRRGIPTAQPNLGPYGNNLCGKERTEEDQQEESFHGFDLPVNSRRSSKFVGIVLRVWLLNVQSRPRHRILRIVYRIIQRIRH
jgi:hypothetical protein